MQPFEFHCPTKIVCGENALAKLPLNIASFNITKPLVVTDANLVALGIAERALAPLREANIPFALYDQVPPDSSLNVVNDVAALYRAESCDGWIALGGGSSIDTAKGAAAAVAVGGKDFTSLQGSEVIEDDLDPLFAIPTTAGTGSEATLVAVVADTQSHAKLSYTSYRLVPRVAFLDPRLTASLPARLTATTGMDALTHAIEAYTSIQKNPISDALAVQAIRLISENLKASCEKPEDLDTRTNLALGSLIAGASFSNAMVGLVHALGHALGGLCRIPHGHAMMLLLPHCVRANRRRGFHGEKYGELLRYLDPRADLEARTPQEKSQRFEEEIFALNGFFHDVYGVAIRLSELGVTRDDLVAVANQARYDGAALYNEQEVTVEFALEILEAAY